VRLLHPQRFSDTLWPLMSQLETFWTSAVGCNTYLTPPSSQGFAPHWDDIDAFILQVGLSGLLPLRIHFDKRCIA
jgi:lysine-specific demethylase/histidyl-hydroxylase NO66